MALYRKDLKDNRYGRLIVTGFKEMRGHFSFWECVCDCGNVVSAMSGNLVSGKTQSCGCLRKEKVSQRRTTHGQSETSLYAVWNSMKARCFNKNNHAYKNYGGRGITVCSEWKSDFNSFYVWACHNGYQKGLTIDRVDVNSNYSPQNCRWVDEKTQALNKRTNHLITVNGITKPISEWERTGLSQFTILARISKLGWSPEDAVSIPVNSKNYL